MKIKSIAKPSILIVAVALMVAVLALVINLMSQPRASYEPYAVDYLALVFNDQKEVNGSADMSFVLEEVKKQGQEGKRVAALLHDPEVDTAEVRALLPYSHDIYVDIFSDLNRGFTSTTTFDNTFGLDMPFELMSFPNKDNSLNIIFDRQRHSLDFVLKGQEVKINDDTIRLNDYIIYQVEGIDETGVVKIDDILIYLGDYQNDAGVTFGKLLEKPIEYYLPSGGNRIATANSSFEEGPWSESVADCSAYLPGEPAISMSLSPRASQGSRSLQLASRNHFACVYRGFDVAFKQENLYLLSFDFNSLAGYEVMYYYNLKNSRGETKDYSGRPHVVGNVWQQENKLIVPPLAEINAAEIYFYAPSDGTKEIVNLFDNVRLYEYTKQRDIALPTTVVAKSYGLSNWFRLNQGENRLEAVLDRKNLISDYNPSFEQGMWENNPSDCSNYLPGDPQFNMLLNSDSTDGNQSLELSSKNHFACTRKEFPVPIETSRLYQLSFDYKSLSGSKVQYYYLLKSGETKQEFFDSFEPTDNEWHRFSTVLDPKIDNIESIDLYLYAPSDGSRNIVNLFDNITLQPLTEKAISNYFLKALKRESKLGQPKALEYRQLSGSELKLIAHSVKEPFLLVYPKSYDKRLALRVFAAERPQQLSIPLDYYVSEEDADVRASKQELSDMIQSGIVSAVGGKPITKNNNGVILNENLNDERGNIFNRLEIDSAVHFSLDDGLNAWLIDPAAVCANDGYCVANEDGTYDIGLVVQKTFNWWLVSVPLAVVLLGIAALLYRRMRKSHENTIS